MTPQASVLSTLALAIALMIAGPSKGGHARRGGGFLRSVAAVLADRVVYGPLVALGALWASCRIGLVPPLADGRMVLDASVLSEALARADLALLVASYGLMSNSLDRSGFMRWCAHRALVWGRGDARRAFFAIFGVASAVTLFTSNDIVVVALTPILLHLGSMARMRNMVPMLVGMFVAANTSAMGMLVGSPTNLVVAQAAGLGFGGYLSLMALPALAATVVAAAVVWVAGSWRRLPGGGIEQHYALDGIAAESARLSTGACVRLAIFGGVLAGMLAMDLAGLPMRHVWLLAGSGACAMVMLDLAPRRTRREAIAEIALRTPWSVPPFLIAFFCIVGALGRAGLVERFGAWIVAHASDDGALLSVQLAYGSMLLANAVNDIPSAILWSDLLPALEQGLADGGDAETGAIRVRIATGAILIGLNTGCYLTVVGALAGLMWRQILRSSPVGAELHKPDGWHLALFGGLAAVVATPAAALVLWLQESIRP